MNRYACCNPGCPRRAPVAATAAPTCYTCGAAMSPAVEPGLSEVIGRFAARLAAAGAIPLSVLLSGSPAGMTLRPIFSGVRPPPERHALDSDDLSERGMERDRLRRQAWDVAELRRRARDRRP